MEKINLIFTTELGSQTAFEEHYLTNFFWGEETQVKCYYAPNTYDTFFNKSFIVYSSNLTHINMGLREYIDKYRRKGLKFGLIHLSDERNVSTDYPPYNSRVPVLRSYGRMDSREYHKNVLPIPLGYQSGFQNGRKSIIRDIPAVFAGSLKQDRQKVVNALKNIPESIVRATFDFNDPTGIKPSELKSLYERTIFVPCPMGWIHYDSFRVMEALESGAIPVIHKNQEKYMAKMFPNNPFLVVNDWNELIEYSVEFQQETKISTMHKFVYQVAVHNVQLWYEQFKSSLTNKIWQHINNHWY